MKHLWLSCLVPLAKGLVWDRPWQRPGTSLRQSQQSFFRHAALAKPCPVAYHGASRLFSSPNVPPASDGMASVVKETATSQNMLFRIPVFGFIFKAIASLKLPSRSTMLSLILAILLARMWWKYSVPTWIKRNVYKALPSRWAPAPQTVTGSERAAPLEAEADTGETGGLFSLPVLASKLGNLFSMAKEQLQSPLEGFALQGSLVATLQIMDKQGEAAEEWNSYYSSAGDPYAVNDTTELLDGLHLSDWAYLEETTELRRHLQGLNITLVRHVKTDEPGRVGHYVGLDTKNKLALITVKGTSELNDMITDACGVPVRYNLTRPYADDAPLNISCHEGVLTASLDLADDVQSLVEELFVPAGYSIRLIGHSLGAGVACLTALLLRSRLSKLGMDVWAYAPPPILNYEAAVACREFCTSIVNHGDVIPRASLSNLVALLRFLSLVNERLEEQGLSPTGPKSMISLWQTLQQGNLTVMTPKEVFAGLREAVSDIELQDMDHLFVPGKVLMFYRKLEAGKSEDQKELDIQSAGIMSDGACQLLRHMDIDPQMLSDHMPDAYEKTLLAMNPS